MPNELPFRLPAVHPVTATERAWIEFLRMLTDDKVPDLTLSHVQGLRLLLQGKPRLQTST